MYIASSEPGRWRKARAIFGLPQSITIHTSSATDTSQAANDHGIGGCRSSQKAGPESENDTFKGVKSGHLQIMR